MLSILILFQVSFFKNLKEPNYLKNNEIFRQHDRINDEYNQISLMKAKFSNFHNPKFNGGAIYITKNRFNFTLSNCQFENCLGNLGGAIYIKSNSYQNSRSCSIYNALFTNCRATNGGALYLKDGTKDRDSITIEGCMFKTNHATENGGSICSISRVKLAIQRCRFENNEANLKGSSIWCLVGNENGKQQQKLILYRNSFKFSAKKNNLVNVYIESNNLSNNSKNSNANVYLGLCSFSSTNVNVQYYKNLEVIENGKFESFNLTDCNCIKGNENSVTIEINSTTNFSDLMIFNCKSIDQCQAQFVVDPKLPATELCVEYPNRMDYIGGSGIELGKSCFSNFRSPIQQDGGAIHLINAQLDLEKCRFINCSTDCKGGAIFATIAIYDCEIEIEDCIFDSCEADEDGGAVYVCICEDYCEMEVDNTQFIGCKSNQNGGGFYVTFKGENCNLEFEDTIFDSCSAHQEGGGLYFLNHMSSRSTFETCNFTNNCASNAGAFYYSPYSYSKLCRCEFINNSCTKSNSSSSVYVFINPNKESEKVANYIHIKTEEENETNDDGEDHNDNIYGDITDNLTSNNVVISDNIFESDPIQNSTQLFIEMMQNAQLLLGKNSFSFNNRDDLAEEMNSNYIKVYKDMNSHLTFKSDGLICITGNSSLVYGIDNVETNCQILYPTFDPDDDYKEISKKDNKKKNKVILLTGVIIGCVTGVAIITIIIILITIHMIKRNELRQYSSKLKNGGDSVASNIDHDTNDDLHVNL